MTFLTARINILNHRYLTGGHVIFPKSEVSNKRPVKCIYAASHKRLRNFAFYDVLIDDSDLQFPQIGSLTQADLNSQGGDSVVGVLCQLLDDSDLEIR